MRKLTKIAAAASTAILALTLGACSNSAGGDSTAADNTKTDGVVTLKVGASPSPHAQILKYINDNLAKKEGIKLDIVEYTDYIQPNEALASGDLDANYFQTVPYLEDQKKQHPNYANFVAGKGIHLEPLGLYSDKVKNVKDLKDGAIIGIISDATNQARALKLLADNGLIKLPASTKGDIKVTDIEPSKEYNPHGFKFKEVEGPQLVRALPDVDAAVINGNFAQEGGKKPSDAIALESAKDNPAANVLVWRKDTKKLAAIEKLEKLLHSPEVKAFIEKTWADKAVIPTF